MGQFIGKKLSNILQFVFFGAAFVVMAIWFYLNYWTTDTR